MGYHISQNIFNLDREKQAEFSSTSCQALILVDEVSDKGAEIVRGIEKDFAAMHDATNDRFAFFVATSVPKGYEDWRHVRTAFKDEQLVEKLDAHGRRNLNFALGRCLGLDLAQLPAVIISPAIWGRGFYVVVPALRSADEIRQLVDYANRLASVLSVEIPERERAEIILRAFSSANDETFQARGPSGKANLRLRMAKVLAAASDRDYEATELRRDVDRTIQQKVQGLESENLCALTDDLVLDWSLAKSAGLKLPDLEPARLIDTSLMDATSLQFYRSGQALLETADTWSHGDFSPAAVGFWKTIEREFNLSVFEASRKAHGVSMPACYAKHDPSKGNLPIALPEVKGFALNKQLRSDHSKIELPMLGHARFIFRWAAENGGVRIEDAIVSEAFDLLETLNMIRRAGSHHQPVTRDQANQVSTIVEKLIYILMYVKRENAFPPNPSGARTSRVFKFMNSKDAKLDGDLLSRLSGARSSTSFHHKSENELYDFDSTFTSLVNTLRPENYADLSDEDQKVCREQIEKQIRRFLVDLSEVVALRRPRSLGFMIKKLLDTETSGF
ncbi:hypothetical protein NOR53_1965 [gamma proteobacterium NOR5-3]|nr:hypothetical protein NOR53_1965 [gamma proteobacterium NOR5-3]